MSSVIAMNESLYINFLPRFLDGISAAFLSILRILFVVDAV